MKMLKQPGFLETTSRHGGRLAIVILAVAAMGPADAVRGQGVPEFAIPTANSLPRSIVAGPDGNLWFTESDVLASRIGRITPAGVITEFVVSTDSVPVRSIAAGPDGNLWFTEGARIGRITTAGVITEFPLPSMSSTNPSSIAAGPDGNLWFTEIGIGFVMVGRITTAGVVTEFPLSNPFNSLGGIAAGPDGNLWFTEGGRIGRITTAGVVTEFPVPSLSTFVSEGSSIVAGPDGALWFMESGGNKIGRITTAGVVTEFAIPSLVGSPNGTTCGNTGSGIAAGPDGALWFTEFSGNRIGRITTAGVITEFAIPTSNSQPFGIAAGPDGNLWFAEYLGNKIGRITPSAACPASATNLCLNNARFKVEPTWMTSDGTSGLGQAVALTPDTGYFWFFSSDSPEVVVKALDGCSFNNHHWLFAAGLTNVNVVLKVTDIETGQVKTYTNPQGTAFQPIQDTGAFACP